MRILFDASQHVARSGGALLGLGNHEVIVEEMELVEKGDNLQFKFTFRGEDKQFTHWAWVAHEKETVQVIGFDFIKKVCDYTGNDSIRLTDDPKSWLPLYDKPFAIGIRKQVKKGVIQTYESKNGETRERYEIAFLARTLDELPPYNESGISVPTAQDIMNRFAQPSANNHQHDDIPY